MVKEKHTPGPWRTITGGFVMAGANENPVFLAGIMGDGLPFDERYANAALMASSPKMYAALLKIKGMLEAWELDSPETLIRMIDDVVDKALLYEEGLPE